MTLVAVKVNEHMCRGVIATNFTHSFCGSSLIKSLGLPHRELTKPPAVVTSDGTPIEFLGEAMVLVELGPWQSDGLIPLLIAWDCPADILIGEDLIKKISKKYPVKFEFYKNAVNIGGTRVSMLDPVPAEEKFISVVVMDPHTQKEVGVENWKKGNREPMEPGGLVKRRVEVVGHGGQGAGGGSSGMAKRGEEDKEADSAAEELIPLEEQIDVVVTAADSEAKGMREEERQNVETADGNTVAKIEEEAKNEEEGGGKIAEEEIKKIEEEEPKQVEEKLEELKGENVVKEEKEGNAQSNVGQEEEELECEEVEAIEV